MAKHFTGGRRSATLILVIAALSRAQVQMVGLRMVLWGLVCVVARWGVIGANVFVCAVAGVTGQ